MPRVVLGVQFFPRGGSAHVCCALAHALADRDWDVTVVSGSRGDLRDAGDATVFYRGLDVRPVDFTPALRSPDPQRAAVPIHPSFEERPGAPDKIVAALDDEAYEHQVAAWCDALTAADAATADVLYLHHLTVLHEAAARVAPDVPVVTHLHGTELLFLETAAIDPPDGWRHAAAWTERMRRWAARSRRLVAGPGGLERAHRVLHAAAVTELPNGVDGRRFAPAADGDRQALWQRALVEEARGWRPGGEPGSVRYDAARVAAAFAPGNPVLVYVGRFTAVKRLPLLLRAHAAARTAFEHRAPLVLIGGYPGEWEGEHPFELAGEDVFLAGWYGHDELPALLQQADAIVLPSVREQFGQVLIEGMACGLPAIAVDRFGPATIVRDGVTGRLVEPDDEAALTAALVEAVNAPGLRAIRGQAARADVLGRYGWPRIARRLESVLQQAAGAVTPA